MTTPNALILVVKNPLVTPVKTRLVGPLTPAEVHALYLAFLQDMIQKVAPLPVNIRIYFPSQTLPFPLSDLLESVTIVPQQGEHMGAILHHAFKSTFDAGYARAVTVAIDAPTLPASYIQQAFNELEIPRTIVLGPTEQKSYYLLGTNEMHSVLFEPTTQPAYQLLEEMIHRITRTGARLTILPQWHTIDTPDDLSRLAAELAYFDIEAPHTRQLVADLIRKYPILASINALGYL